MGENERNILSKENEPGRLHHSFWWWKMCNVIKFNNNTFGFWYARGKSKKYFNCILHELVINLTFFSVDSFCLFILSVKSGNARNFLIHKTFRLILSSHKFCNKPIRNYFCNIPKVQIFSHDNKQNQIFP